MSSGSVRHHATYDIHQHQEPPDSGDDREAIPDSRCENGACKDCRDAGRLWREDGKVLYQAPDRNKPEAARVLWARPLSGRGGPVSVMMAGKKRELAYFESLDNLDPESRRVAEEELADGLILPRITAVRRVRPRFGNYYWDVETDMGPRRFLLTSPENNSFHPRPDVIVVKDVAGNCYEINPVSGLSPESLREIDRVL